MWSVSRWYAMCGVELSDQRRFVVGIQEQWRLHHLPLALVPLPQPRLVAQHVPTAVVTDLYELSNISCWFCSVGVNIGWEEDGKNTAFDRPVLIVKKFWPSLFLGIPFTSKKQSGKGVFHFMHDDCKFIAIFSQIRVFDARRLRRRLTTIEEVIFGDLLKAFKEWL